MLMRTSAGDKGGPLMKEPAGRSGFVTAVLLQDVEWELSTLPAFPNSWGKLFRLCTSFLFEYSMRDSCTNYLFLWFLINHHLLLNSQLTAVLTGLATSSTHLCFVSCHHSDSFTLDYALTASFPTNNPLCSSPSPHIRISSSTLSAFHCSDCSFPLTTPFYSLDRSFCFASAFAFHLASPNWEQLPATWITYSILNNTYLLFHLPSSMSLYFCPSSLFLPYVMAHLENLNHNIRTGLY